MNLDQWAALVNEVSNNPSQSYATSVAAVAALSFGGNFGIADTTEMTNAQTYITAQAALPWESRATWYRANSPLFSQASGGVPIYGPNLVLSPNGPYTSGDWAVVDVTETGSATDPLGGTTAYTLIDNSTSAQHEVFSAVVIAWAEVKYAFTFYFQAGTYPNGMCLQLPTYSLQSDQVTITNGGTVVGSGTVTGLKTQLVGGWFQVTGTITAPVATGTGYWVMFFGTAAPTYIGSSQTMRVWGLAFQTST